MKAKIYHASLIIALAVALSSCADAITEHAASIDDQKENVIIAPTFSDIQKNIFNQSCAFSGCHSGSVSPDLSSNAYSNIVNIKGSTGINYITPNDPDNSYLLQKILGSASISGSSMPYGASPLSQESINSLTEWINDGAKNN